MNRMRFKRGDAARLEVVFLENGVTPAAIGDPAQLELRFCSTTSSRASPQTAAAAVI